MSQATPSTRGRRQPEPSALRLLEDGVRLLRANPSLLALHLAGSVPFTGYFLFYWADMSRSAFAADHAASGAILLGLVFLAMKSVHGIVGAELLARLQRQSSAAWTPGRIWRLACTQVLPHSIGLFVLSTPLLLPGLTYLSEGNPLAKTASVLVGLVLGLGWGWAYAFFQGVTIVGDRAEGRLRHCLRDAGRQALGWPVQNHAALGLMSVFGIVIWVNCALALFTGPSLLKLLLGVESDYTLSQRSLLNTTFFASALLLAWHVVDPLLKAYYALRVFHREARQSGADIRARLETLRQGSWTAVAMVALLWVSNANGFAAESATSPPAARNERASSEVRAASPERLDQSFDEILQRREYTWREPGDRRPSRDSSQEDSLTRMMRSLSDSLEAQFRAALRALEKFLNWILPNTGPTGGRSNGGSMDWTGGLTVVLYVVVALALVFISFHFAKAWRQNSAVTEAIATATPVPVPDLLSETVAASELPEDGWLRMARELAGRGEYRLALRALYLASLVSLSSREWLSIARHKTNRDYLREVQRRGRVEPRIPETFARLVQTFDRVWYGTLEVTPESLRAFEDQVTAMRNPAPIPGEQRNA